MCDLYLCNCQTPNKWRPKRWIERGEADTDTLLDRVRDTTRQRHINTVKQTYMVRQTHMQGLIGNHFEIYLFFAIYFFK